MAFIKCVAEVVRKTMTVSHREQGTVALQQRISLSLTGAQYCKIITLFSSLSASRIK